MNEKERFLLLRGVRIPGNGSGKSYTADLLIRRQEGRGSIAGIARGNGQSELSAAALQARLGEKAAASALLTVRQAKGGWLLPAFIDTFAAFGHPDYFYREDPVSGGNAALAGGFSDILLAPQKRLGAVGALQDLRRRFADCPCRAHFAAGLLPAGGHGAFSEPEILRSAGFTVLTDHGGSALPDEQLYSLMKKAAAVDSLLLLPIRCDPTGAGQLHEGRVSRLTGAAGIDPVFGLLSLSRILLLAGRSGCRVHLPVVAGKAQLEMIRRAKADGVGVTCGTTPAYFSMTEDDVIYRGAAAKLDPPLQTGEDREALLEGLRDGTIDCICSGHTPLSRYEKQGSLTAAKPGAAMLEAVFPAAVTYLLEPGVLGISRLRELLCDAPAEILRLPPRPIAEGASADLCLVEPEAEWICESETLKGKAANLPYLGMAMHGRVREILLDGTPVG